MKNLGLQWELVCPAMMSIMACGCMLRHLMRSPGHVRRRLFWKQLLMMTCFDVLQGVGHLASSNYYSVLPQVMPAATFLDLSSCFWELCIAMGFAAGAIGWSGAVSCLRPTIALPVCIVLNVFLTIPSYFELGVVQMGKNGVYEMLAYAVLTMAFYICGIACSLHFPTHIRARACAQALCYAASYGITVVPFSVASLIYLKDSGWESNRVTHYVRALFHLNGAANVVAYASWVVLPRKDIPTLTDMEASLISGFFDLDDSIAEDVISERRVVAVAVATAREIRSSSSVSEITEITSTTIMSTTTENASTP